MSGFVFQWPLVLLLLLLAIPLGLLLAHARRQRLKLIEAMGGGMTTHRRLRDVLRLSSFVLLVFAVARPGHSPQAEATSRTGRDVVFALDVSQSMLAEDASPSRLEVAKQGIRDALASFGNERVGLVLYAGSASILCPLTYDYDFVRYMLDQANPRSVDFGGTALQSAVEKVVDQVLVEGREGVQDLIVLTDGGDHGSRMAKVIELLKKRALEVLVIGIGDPNGGSPIPVQDEKGNRMFLQDDGLTVYTKLDDAALRAFAAATPLADYVPVGTSPFNLGQLYRDYAADKQVEAADIESGVVIYQEAAALFLLPALLLLVLAECWGARGLQLGTAVFSLLLGFSFELKGADGVFRSGFETGTKLFKEQQYEEAEQTFTSLYENTTPANARAGDLAALQVNRGLCLLKLSQAQAQENPRYALNLAQDAQLAFLSAKRYASDLRRAGIRLEAAAQWVQELCVLVEQEEKADEELQEQMLALIERLQVLLEAQIKLRKLTVDKDVNRRRPPNRRNQPPPPPIVPPGDAAQSSRQFVRDQGALYSEGRAILAEISTMNQKLAVPGDMAVPGTETVLEEPLRLMQEAVAAQQAAGERFAEWPGWPAARGEQDKAIRNIQKILELLAGNPDQDSEESDQWEEDDEGESTEDESESTQSTSRPVEGDLAGGAEMQPLPVPNYSVEDILQEEQGSLQFRQQKRADANAAKVEKDY